MKYRFFLVRFLQAEIYDIQRLVIRYQVGQKNVATFEGPQQQECLMDLLNQGLHREVMQAMFKTAEQTRLLPFSSLFPCVL